MSSEVRLRVAEPDDLSSLLRLLALMHDQPPPSDVSELPRLRATFERLLAQRGRFLIVASIDAAVVATADMAVHENLSRGGRPWAIVENVVVEPANRRQGIARLMMMHLIDQAEALGCYKVQLLSNERRSEAHVLYEGLGFDAPVRGFRRYLP